jgi:hypothetical protein
MALSTGLPNLTGTIYSQSDFEAAHTTMSQIFEKYAPQWPDTPTGVFSEYWDKRTKLEALNVIEVASTLSVLARTITAASEPIFARKVNEFLYCQNRKQYEELLAELRVGSLLGHRAPPVFYEPLVRPVTCGDASRPISPDFSIRLSDGDVAIEVTTLHCNALDRWEQQTKIIEERIRSAVLGASLCKEIEFWMPLGIQADTFKREDLRMLIQAMEATETGRYRLPLGSAAAEIIWRNLHIFNTSNGRGAQHLQAIFPSDQHFAAVGGSGIRNAIAFKTVPVLDQESNRILVKSLRNTINGKRNQLRFDEPTLLVIQASKWRISAADLLGIIERQIWPNTKYAWLTGIGIFQPRANFELSAPASSLTVTWNTQPRVPRTESLFALIESNARFGNGKRIDKP